MAFDLFLSTCNDHVLTPAQTRAAARIFEAVGHAAAGEGRIATDDGGKASAYFDAGERPLSSSVIIIDALSDKLCEVIFQFAKAGAMLISSASSEGGALMAPDKRMLKLLDKDSPIHVIDSGARLRELIEPGFREWEKQYKKQKQARKKRKAAGAARGRKKARR